MRRLSVLLAAVFLSTFLAVTVNAAPKDKSTATETPQGVQNALKVMQSRVARDKEMHKKLDKAQAHKETKKGKGTLEQKN